VICGYFAVFRQTDVNCWESQKLNATAKLFADIMQQKEDRYIQGDTERTDTFE